MSQPTRNQMGRECPPAPDPADQPLPPNDGKRCDALEDPKAPKVKDDMSCPEPAPGCQCPSAPDSSSQCLETLIDNQPSDATAAEQANKFKAELTKLLETTKKASLDYTNDTYDKLVTEWTRQDVAIAELLRKLVCAVPCWRCIIECHICPLLHELHKAEKLLYDNGNRYDTVHDLYDEQYWHSKNAAAHERTFHRIVRVLKAWETPAKTIQETLEKNNASIESIGPLIGSQPGKAIYEVFFRLVPLHLAVAPPQGSDWVTKIDKRYTTFCEFGLCDPDTCCGPDVGPWSLRQRLIGPPRPYLIHPNDYFKVICCLVEQRYMPAKRNWNKAVSELNKVSDRIARLEALLKEGWVKNFEAAAKGAIPSVIDCCEYEPDADDTNQSSQDF